MDFNLQTYRAEQLLHLGVSPARRICVQQNERHRWLEIDGVVQSAMVLSAPHLLCLPHQQTIAALLPARASRVLELGLGGGDMGRHLQARWPEAEFDGVDLDAEVISLYRDFFMTDEALGRQRLHRADALSFLMEAPGCHDLILVDLFSQDGNPPLLFSPHFYQALAARLEGELIMNLLPRTGRELDRVLTLVERWIGPAQLRGVPGCINQIVHARQG